MGGGKCLKEEGGGDGREMYGWKKRFEEGGREWAGERSRERYEVWNNVGKKERKKGESYTR